MKKKILDILKKVDWKSITPATYARYILMIIGILNSLLTMLGLNPIPFSEDNVYQTVSDIYTLVMLVVNTWYNNSVTPAAIAADAYMKKVKNGEPSESEKDSE